MCHICCYIYEILKGNISDLNTLRKNSSQENIENIDNVIDLYKNRKTSTFKTERNVVVNLAFPTGYSINSSV